MKQGTRRAREAPGVPRYFFNLHADPDTPDEEGRELAGPEAARECALEAARELVCADIKHGWLNLDHSIDVTDDQGAIVLTVTFREAFEVGKRS